MKISSIPIKNIKRGAWRTTAIIAIVVLIYVTLFLGVLMVNSLTKGIDSLETRLGADVLVVPDEAKSKENLEEILLDGVPGYFYMDKDYLDKVRKTPGIDKISPQFYLASTKSGCCSMPVQIIGYDPKTDFTVTPWIRTSGAHVPHENEALAGSNINVDVGSSVKFFGVKVKVIAKLDQTGTNLDNAIYTAKGTIDNLIDGSKRNSFKFFSSHDPGKIISSILIDVSDGYSPSDIEDYINIHVNGVTAVSTTDMLSGVSRSMSGISSVLAFMISFIAILLIAALFFVFSLMVNERKKEFATLRMIGLTRKRLAMLVLEEAAIEGLIGSLAGAIIATILSIPISYLMKNLLGLPFLMSGVTIYFLMIMLIMALTIATVSLASVRASQKLSKQDAAVALRES